MNIRCSMIAAATLAAAQAFATPAFAAEPGPIGHEFLAGDRVLLVDDDDDDRSCRTGDGTSIFLAQSSNNWSDPNHRVYVDRTTTDGVALPRIELEPRSAPSRLFCSRGRTFTTILQKQSPSSIYRVATLDADGTELGSFEVNIEEQWITALAADDAGLFVVRSSYTGTGYSYRAYAQWLGFDGSPVSPEATLREDSPGYMSSMAATIDDARNVLVTWIDSETWQYNQSRMTGIFFDSGARTIGSAFTVNERMPAYFSDRRPTVVEADGLFTVYWYTEEHGGRTGRLVSIDPDTIFPEPTTTTTLPPAGDDGLGFSEPRTIGTVSLEADFRKTFLETDGAGTWLAAWYQSVWDVEDWGYEKAEWRIARSTDNGRHWQPVPDANRWYHTADIEIAPDGTALDIEGNWDAGLDVHVSRDGGKSWSADASIPAPTARPADDQRWRGTSLAAVATDREGVWGAAWMVQEGRYPDPADTAVLYAAFSYDDAHSWQGAREIFRSSIVDGTKLEIAPGGAGRWTIAWQSWGEPAIRAVRSSTDGLTWGEPEVALAFDGIDHRSLELARAGKRSIVTFASRAIDVERFGADGDIFAITADDGAGGWSEPVAVNGHARVDGATDETPSLAVDSDGTAMVAWKSHESLGGALGYDADILRSTSLDGGRTWSWPIPVNPDAASDTGPQAFPKIAAGADGTWMAAWHVYPYGWGDGNHEIVVAAAPFRCGDGVVDPAEQCDDANEVANDGCDPNCTRSDDCGNGIVNDGEECDDGNLLFEDGCIECRLAVCGDGIVLPYDEECDVAATDDGGWCTSSCMRATCGDGHVHVGVEDCDDANDDYGDDCAGCWYPRCGDYAVWRGHEECDDGDSSDTDECVNGCHVATCGDGFLHAGVEACDPGLPIPFHPCQPDCRFVPLCGDFATSAYRATDALEILRVALGILPVCPLPLCDLNSNGKVSVVDALLALNAAVADLRVRNCTSSSTVRIVLDDERSFGSIDVELGFPELLGTFDNGGRKADCTSGIPGVYYATNAWQPGLLRTGAITGQSVSGPAVYLECTFFHDPASPPTARDFKLLVRQGSSLSGETYDRAEMHVEIP